MNSLQFYTTLMTSTLKKDTLKKNSLKKNKNATPQDLKGLGPKSRQCLMAIGIYSKSDLERMGPVNAFIKIKHQCRELKPSLNLLYGLVAALEGVHWREVARNDKYRLLMELESQEEAAILHDDSFAEK